MASGRLILPVAEPVLEGSPSTPIVGATLTVNIAGTGTLANLFADAGLTTPITNPQTSNSNGLFYEQATVIWADATQAYDCIVNWPDGTSDTFASIYLVGAASNVSGFAPINSPAFTGNPTAPEPALNDNSNSLATTNYVQGQNYAPLASPAFTGVPTVPTAAAATNTTQAASTAFVETALGITAPTGTSSGYYKIGGIILQWAPFTLGAAGGATVTVNWPLTFPTGVLGQPWVTVMNGAVQMIGVTAVTATSVSVDKGVGDTFARTGTVWAVGN